MEGAAIAAAVCAVLVGAWAAATQLYLFPVDPEKIEITNVRQLSDGRVLYHLYIDDDRNLREIRFEYDDEGKILRTGPGADYGKARRSLHGGQ